MVSQTVVRTMVRYDSFMQRGPGPKQYICCLPQFTFIEYLVNWVLLSTGLLKLNFHIFASNRVFDWTVQIHITLWFVVLYSRVLHNFFGGTCPVGQVIFQKGKIYLPERKFHLPEKRYGLEYIYQPSKYFFSSRGLFFQIPNKKEPPSVFSRGLFLWWRGLLSSCIFFFSLI